jgi:FKBP-type peptidyl-prolyl cis-trans isomerase 2
MQNEKIAVIALIVIIAGALSVYLISANQEDLLKSLFPSGNNNPPITGNTTVAEGDCIDIQYIGRYASNGTVFNSSYTDDNYTVPGIPLKIFVTLDPTKSPPTEYQANYTSGIIEGLMEKLIGLKLGKTYTLNIPADEAYGAKKFTVGAVFNSSVFAFNYMNPNLSLNQTLKVTSINDTFFSLEWINIDTDSPFTMPQYIIGNLSNENESVITLPPYYIWENSSEITSIGNDTVTVKTTPTTLESIKDTIEPIQVGIYDAYIIFPDVTTATYNETTITLNSNPTVGEVYNFTFDYYGQVIKFIYTVEEVTSSTVNVSETYEYGGSTYTNYINANITYSFDRIYKMKKIYTNIPIGYLDFLNSDIEREGYSLNKLAGENLIFDVYIQNIIKTSQMDN